MKVAIVTGATSGLGRSMAIRLVKEHSYIVVGNGRNEQSLNELQELLGRNFRYVSGNVYDPEVLGRVIAKCEGRIDLLINNAGTGYLAPFSDFPQEKLIEIVNTNILGATILAMKALPYLQETKGLLINISSILGHFPTPYNIVYSATKHYLNGLSRGINQEYHDSGIRVLTVCPSSIKTNFIKNSIGDRQASENYVQMGDDAEKIVSRIFAKMNQRNHWLYPTRYAAALATIGRVMPSLSDFLIRKFVKRRTSRNVHLSSAE